jgi:nucleoside-diphosphate-sugar epimerase
VRDPAGTDMVNLHGSLQVLLAARDAGVKGVVFSSTCAVYGLEPRLPARETDAPAPLSPYAVQKLAVEYYAGVFARLYGMRVFCLRYFNVFGPRQDPGSSYGAVIPKFVEALCRSSAPTIYGDGKQTRDFVYVEDVADANIRCMEAPAEAVGIPINVASGKSASVVELAAEIASVVGSKMAPRYEAARPGDVHHSRGDASRARRLLGWEARTSLGEGLRHTVDHFKAISGAAPKEGRR